MGRYCDDKKVGSDNFSSIILDPKGVGSRPITLEAGQLIDNPVGSWYRCRYLQDNILVRGTIHFTITQYLVVLEWASSFPMKTPLYILKRLLA